MKNKKYIKQSTKYIWHPCSQMKHHEKTPLIPIREGRGSWLIDFNNKKYLDVLFDKDEILHNYYSAIPLNPKKFPYVEYKKAMIFIKWLLGKEGKSTINNFKINDQQLFFTK